MNESCESRIANLIASMTNLPENAFGGKIDVLKECIVELERKLACHEEQPASLVHEPEVSREQILQECRLYKEVKKQ
jgi:hypothetical protein